MQGNEYPEDQLANMLKAQRDLQIESFGVDPVELDDEARMEFIRWNTLALIAELVEMLDETGWKVWASSNHVNVDAAHKEMTDAWHFYCNLLWAIDGRSSLGDSNILAETFTQRYFAKRQINAQRQAEGYTGLDKCPACHRDRKTTARMTPDDVLEQYEYCPCGHVYA